MMSKCGVAAVDNEKGRQGALFKRNEFQTVDLEINVFIGLSIISLQ